MQEYPQKIVCLTEETVEALYAIGREDLIAGISHYVKRPPHAANSHPKVSFFLSSDYKKIDELNPDLVVGFSDIQKTIASKLIEKGHNVLVTNQRSLTEILQTLNMFYALIGETNRGKRYTQRLSELLTQTLHRTGKRSGPRPKVYFEEWNDPQIIAIEWVMEAIEACGGNPILPQYSKGKMAKERFVDDDMIEQENPDIILGCWCGRPVDIPSIYKRFEERKVAAIQTRQVFELDPAVFLQPGPAIFEEGFQVLSTLFESWSESDFSQS